MLGVGSLPGLGANTAPDVFEVWPENWETLGVFLALGTQWQRVMGLAGAVVTGIHYPAVTTVFEIYGVTDRRAMFEDLRAMESAALAVFNGG